MSSLKIIGLFHFWKFFGPTEEIYNLQSIWITLYHEVVHVLCQSSVKVSPKLICLHMVAKWFPRGEHLPIPQLVSRQKEGIFRPKDTVVSTFNPFLTFFWFNISPF